MPDDLEKDNTGDLISPTNPAREAVLDAVIQNAPLGILIVNDEGVIDRFNDKASQILENANDLEGRHVEELVHNDADKEVLRSLMSSPTDTPKLIKIYSSSGKERQIQLTSCHISSFICLYVADCSQVFTLEQELRSFKTAINSAADAILLFDKDGMIFFSNPAFEKQVGLSQEKILGRELQCFWSDKDSAEKHAEIWQCIHSARPWFGEMTWVPSNHSLYNVEVRMTPILMEEQQVVGFICVQRNITERKRIQQQLLDYSENLERLVVERTKSLENLHDITQLFHSTKTLEKRLRLLLISATADEVFRFNRAFLLLADNSKQHLVGRIAFGPSSPEEANMVWNKVQNIPRSESLADTLLSYLENSGSGEQRANQIVQNLSVPLTDETSILVQSIQQKRSFVIRNGITDLYFNHEIIEQLGNDNFAVFPMMVQDEPVGVLVADNAITKRPINEEDIQFLDILVSQAALAIAHADAMEQLAKKMQETEHAYSDLRASQEKLIEASKFAALGQMAATVAHEIRTPLVAIGGFINMMFKKRVPGDDDYNHMKIVRDESLRLEDVLNRLLFYARPNSPFKELNDMNALIDYAVALLETECEEYKISINIERDHIPLFLFDRNQMRQVLMNILQNSIQSIENGGRITIRLCKDNNGISITVCDTGVGIAPKNLGLIFEPFFSTKHTGTGLGMHVSQRIIQNHGGSIHVNSHQNEGTEVEIHLPKCSEEHDEKDTDN